jgi:transcriptional regulator with XRE-family HTH domain
MVGTVDGNRERGFPPDDGEFPLDEGFGKRLERAREAAGFKSPRALSVHIGLSDGTVMSYEKGEQEPKLSVLKKLAAACSTSIDWLANGTGPMEYHQVGAVLPDGSIVAQGPFMPFAAGEPLPPPPSETRGLFATLDIELAVHALQLADRAFADKGAVPTDRERVQVMAILYDQLKQQYGVPKEEKTSDKKD